MVGNWKSSNFCTAKLINNGTARSLEKFVGTRLDFVVTNRDMTNDKYKLGKILATSAIISDVPLGSDKPKRSKLKLVILALIVAYTGYALFIHEAAAHLRPLA